MALSEEVSNRIILPGGELRLPDRDLIGEEVVDFFGRYRAEFAIFSVAGVAEDGGLLEFHAAEVRACNRLRQNDKASIRLEERRAGKGWVSRCRTRGWPYSEKTKKH